MSQPEIRPFPDWGIDVADPCAGFTVAEISRVFQVPANLLEGRTNPNLIVSVLLTDHFTEATNKVRKAFERLGAVLIATSLRRERKSAKRRTPWWRWQARSHEREQPNHKRWRSRRAKAKEVQTT